MYVLRLLKCLISHIIIWDNQLIKLMIGWLVECKSKLNIKIVLW